MSRKERFEKVLNYFSVHNPTARTELKYRNPYELIVSVILSAQCTDARVNMTTPLLFKKYPNVEALSKATPDEVYSYIKSISYPNNKAKHLVNMAKMLVNDFGGKVPSEVHELMKLPGVGRKTANVVASVIYNRPTLAVDTHVFRVSGRIGLTVGAKNPYQAEVQLLKYIPENQVAIAHHWLILHGRYVCTARNPKCPECGIRAYCRYYSKNY